MRKSYAFFLFIAVCLLSVSALFVVSKTEVSRFQPVRQDIKDLVVSLRLTDMSFSTDARYTRHPSQADLFSAFQDYPGSIEHFPSGSVIARPDFSPLQTKISIMKR